ncbi:MAG: YceI family protein [Parvularculaceae bacterium]
MNRLLVLTSASLFALVACGQPKTAEPASDAAPPAEAAEAVSAEAIAAAETATAAAAVDVSGTIAGVYKSDPGHAYITFSYDHQGYSRPWLRWRTWSGDLNWNPAAPEQSSITATIDATSADSGVDAFDEHLRSADFFDVANHPTIAFASTGLSLNGPASGVMTGNLTIKGVTKPVTLDVTINKAADDAFAKGYKLGFSGKGAVKRSDFGVDKYTPFVGDDVTVLVEAEFVLPKEQPAEAAPAQ